jgi:hypothetical protein
MSFRASRQRLLLQARKLKMMCVPEGGQNLEWDLSYMIDGQYSRVHLYSRHLTKLFFFSGMTTVEHALPVPVLYDDVITLFALSGTGSTPTHLVNYVGAWGEQYVWTAEDVPNDTKYVSPRLLLIMLISN